MTEEEDKIVTEISTDICRGCKQYHKCENNIKDRCMMADHVAVWLYEIGYRKVETAPKPPKKS